MKLPFKQTLGAGAVTALFVLFWFAISSCHYGDPAPLPVASSDSSNESFNVSAPIGSPVIVKCVTSIGCTGSSIGSGSPGGTHNPFVTIYGFIFTDSEGKIGMRFTTTLPASH